MESPQPDPTPATEVAPAIAEVAPALAPVATRSHARTIWEVVGVLVAVVLIGLAAVSGFALGYLVRGHETVYPARADLRDGDGWGMHGPNGPWGNDQRGGPGWGTDRSESMTPGWPHMRGDRFPTPTPVPTPTP